MDGPAIELFHCEALNARISRQQCRTNQAQAEKRQEPATRRKTFNGCGAGLGLLRFCLECTQKDGLAEQEFRPAQPVAPAAANYSGLAAAVAGPGIRLYPQEARKNMSENMTSEVEKINMEAKPELRRDSKVPKQELGNQGDKEKDMPSEKIKEIDLIICARCGNPKRPDEMHWAWGKPTKYCRECKNTKLRETKAARAGWSVAPAPAGIGAALVLDFTGREEILEYIREIAASEERTVQGQIMYWLKKHVRREGRE